MKALLTIAALLTVLMPAAAQAAPMARDVLAELIRPPYSLGPAVNGKGVYALLNSGGGRAGYVFETEPLAPLPGFSGDPVNALVLLDRDGRFIEVSLLSHNEPVFVSGLGEAPFHGFFAQYQGLSLSAPLAVGTPYGGGGSETSLVYLDGVTKATASVRIAHESVMASALAVAREKMKGVAAAPPARPDPDYREHLSWDRLTAEGIATRKTVLNAEIDAAFEETVWEDDDPEAKASPQAPYLDLWIIDIGPPSIAEAVLSADSFRELQEFLAISPEEEPLLLIETGRHQLVGPDFVRNTAPAWLSAEQDGLPVALRDSDLQPELSPDLPEELHDGVRMILRAGRQLGFDPARPWTLQVSAVRKHGMFQPETGKVTIEADHATPERYFTRPAPARTASPAGEALRARQGSLMALFLYLCALTAVLLFRPNTLTERKVLTPFRLAALTVTAGFIGYWGQGQLSVVTVLAVLRAWTDGSSFAFLAYDPFSLMVWGFAILGFVLWGRAYFCGWLCPFGALQELAAHAGRLIGLPAAEPSPKWDRRLKCVKYLLLAGLAGTVFLGPEATGAAAEAEPFKTVVTTGFQREWYFVLYAVFWLASGMVLFKGFCRYVCPLGAFMALGGLLRGRNWIARRQECGSPCQLCKVKCQYGAIKPSGSVDYTECFGCLDCVSIHEDPARCVPKILSARRAGKQTAAE